MPDYLVSVTIPGDGLHGENRDLPTKRERLVRAKNQAQAIKHVVSDTIAVAAATGEDYMRVASQGGKIEEAKDE